MASENAFSWEEAIGFQPPVNPFDPSRIQISPYEQIYGNTGNKDPGMASGNELLTEVVNKLPEDINQTIAAVPHVFDKALGLIGNYDSDALRLPQIDSTPVGRFLQGVNNPFLGGLVDSGANQLTSMATPGNVAAMATGAIVPKFIPAFFGGAAATQLPETGQNLYESFRDPAATGMDRGRAAGDFLATLGIAGLSARGTKPARVESVETVKPKGVENALLTPTEQIVPGVRPRNEVVQVPAEVSSSKADVGGNKGTVEAKTETVTDFNQKFSAQEKLNTRDAVDAGLKIKTVADLDSLAGLRRQSIAETRELRAKAEAETNPAKQMELLNQSLARNAQLPREAIEAATNTGGHVEGAGKYPVKYGERPLDWKNNPEVARWLEKNAEDLGITLPENFKVPKAEEVAIESVTALDPATGTPLSATDSLINKLETPKQPVTKTPSIIPEGWTSWADVTIQRGRSLGVKPVDGSELLAAYAIKGAKIIESGVKDFKKWGDEMILEYGDEVQPHLNAVWNQSKALNEAPPSVPPVTPPGEVLAEVPGEGQKMRKLSERGTEAESVPAEVQKQIAEAPQSFYTPQSMAEVQGRVKGMSDAELAIVPESSDIFTAAHLERADRLFTQGKNAEGYQVFQDLSEKLTRLGQVINQAKMLNSLRPEHVVTVVNESLKQAKRDPLKPEQAAKIEGAAKARIESQRAQETATDAWVKDPTDANAVKAEKALDAANKAALEEQRQVHKFQNKSMASLLKAILQGNLLTPISQVANVVGNMSFLPFRAGTRAGAATIDMIDSALRNRPRQVSVGGTVETAAGLIKGIKQIPGILARGSGDVIKGEQRVGIQPIRAWIKQFSKNPEAPTVGGKIPFQDRVKLVIEGTLGVPAEIMLRGLGAGDVAFREAARARLISEQSRLVDVPKNQRSMAQKFPELFFDKETLARIENETRGAIFQRHSPTIDRIISWSKSKGEAFDLFMATIAPYKLTPWNIVGEILSYNPAIAMGKTAIEAKRGNIRAAEMNAGKMVVGSMLAGSGWYLYQKGLIGPSMDKRNEQQKARVLAGQVLPPNHINISGLKRAMQGEDSAFKPGDETRDIFRAGGLAGSMWYMMGNIGRDMETKPETDNAITSLIQNSTLEQARFGLNQSFLKGVIGLLDAVRDGEADNYLQSYAGTVLSIPLPNTLSALSRAERKYKVDSKADGFVNQLSNVLKTRLGFTGMDDSMPLKRGLWGEPMPETPKGSNALLYHFFDITKGQQVTDDPVPLELYRLWRKTADTSIIPTPPDKTVTFNKQTFLVTPEQRSSLAELVGTSRREIVDKLVINPDWHKLPDEAKIDILKKAYDAGLKIGKAKLFQEFQGQLTPKPEKVGFGNTLITPTAPVAPVVTPRAVKPKAPVSTKPKSATSFSYEEAF